MPDTTPRSPFNPSPRPQGPTPVEPARKGCGKPAVIGCLVLLVLTGIGLIALLYYVAQNYDRLMVWTLDRVRDGVVARLPGDLPAEDRQRLDAAFADAKGAAAASRRDPAVAQTIQLQLLELARQGEGTGPLTREQVEELIRTLEKIADSGKAPPAKAP